MNEKPSGDCRCPYCDESICDDLPDDVESPRCKVEIKACPKCGGPIAKTTGICTSCGAEYKV